MCPYYQPRRRTTRTAYEHWRQREQRRRQQCRQDLRAITFETTVHHENLLRIYDRLAAEAGQAPGPDGIR